MSSSVTKPQADPRAVDQLCINTIRTLAMDGVQQANSGHPGTAMAMAPVIYTLWQNHLRFDPTDPFGWFTAWNAAMRITYPNAFRYEQIDPGTRRSRTRRRGLLQDGVGERGGSGIGRHFAQLQADLQQLDAGHT